MHDCCEKRQILQEAMTFLGAVSGGMEEALGDPANSLAYLAGEKLGRTFSEQVHKTDNIIEALDELHRVLEENRCLWCFESFKPKAQDTLVQRTEGGEEIMLVFRDCMIRQTLFRFGHPQKGSLCNLMNGFFASSLQTIMERKSRLEIVHAGQNACYKKLIIEQK
ncbi:MAG TPA: hypothetical protein VGL38_14810 [bacterium]|jgi:predicted hydrocarbon binding protein